MKAPALAVFMLLFSLFAMMQMGYGQRRYAIEAIPLGSGVSNASNAASLDGVTEPILMPRARISVSGSSSTGNITLRFASSMPANSVIYIRVSDVTTGGGGANVSVQALNVGSVVASSSTLLTMADNSVYYRVVIAGVADRVRMTAQGGNIVLNTTASLNVHYAFYEPVGPQCATVIGTSTSIDGVLGLASISNPGLAIDKNLGTYSNFSVTVGLATTLSQHVYFSNLSNPNEAITVTFSVPSAILNLGLLEDIRVTAYNGSAIVSGQSLTSLLRLDLLGLLNGGTRYSVSYEPTGPFDRITVSMANGLGLLGALRVHEIERTPAKPTVPVAYPNVIEACEGDVVSITATSPTAGSILRWYDVLNDGTLLKTSASNVDTYTTAPLVYTSAADTTFLYVASAWQTGCPAESERAKVAIVVRQRPVVPVVPDRVTCAGQAATLSVTSPVGGLSYRWYSASTGGTVVHTGGTYTLSNPTTTTTYYVEAYNGTCASATRTAVQLTVNQLPGLTLLPAAVSLCEGETQVGIAYAVINGADQYRLIWDAGTPGSFAGVGTWETLSPSQIIVAIPGDAAVGSYTGKMSVRNSITGCESLETTFSVQVLARPAAPTLDLMPQSSY